MFGATVSTVTFDASRPRRYCRRHRSRCGEAVSAVGQRGGGEAPDAAAVGDRRADLGGAVEYLDGAVGAAVPVRVRVLTLVMPSPTTLLSVE